VLEEVLEEEMTEHLRAGYRELTPTRRGERNGRYVRSLVTPAGKIERLTVPRDRRASSSRRSSRDTSASLETSRRRSSRCIYPASPPARSLGSLPR
jgi:transposase-like protein